MVVAVRSASTAAQSTTSTTLTLALPSGVVDGDLLLAFIAHKSGGGSLDVPSGWTAVGDKESAGGWVGSRVFYRVASGEGATQDFTSDTAEKLSGVMLRLDGQLATPVNASASDSSTDPTQTASLSPSATTTIDGCLVLSFHANREVSAPIAGSPPVGTTQIAFVDVAFGTAAAVAGETQSTAGASGAKSWTLAQPGRWAAWTVAIAPATGNGGAGGGPVPRGLYLKSPEGDQSGIPPPGFWSDVNSSPRIRGACVEIFWDNIETSEGVYDFSVIDNAIAEASAISKQLSLELRAYNFGASATNPNTTSVPSYIINDQTTYGGLAGAGGLALKSNGQYTLRRWDPNVMERMTRLYEEVLRYCDGKLPKAVFTNESTVGDIDTSRPDASDYTVAGCKAQFRILIERATAAGGTDTRFVFVGNFIKNGNNGPGGDVDDVYDDCVDNDTGWSFPDPNTPVGGWSGTYRMHTHALAGSGTASNPGKAIPVLAFGEQGDQAFAELDGYLTGTTTLLDMALYMIENVKTDLWAITQTTPAGNLGWSDVVSLLDDNNVPATDLATLQAWAMAPDSPGGGANIADQVLPSLTQAAIGVVTGIPANAAAQTLPSLRQAGSGKSVYVLRLVIQDGKWEVD